MLIAGILLSALLHLLVGLLWRGEPGKTPAPMPAAPLRVLLGAAKAQAPQVAPPFQRGGGRSYHRPPPDGRLPSFAMPDTTNALQAESHPAAAGSLLELAKRQIDKDSRRQIGDPMFAAPARQAGSALSPLAQALDAPVAGERRIGDRLHQYTTAGGRRFCISAPPDIDPASRDLPTPARTLVATNCPQ